MSINTPTNQNKSNLQAALEYAQLGYRVFPAHGFINSICTCGRGGEAGHKSGKHPATAHGFKDATTDADAIRSMWTVPQYNVAIATGGRVMVVETDHRHGGDKTLATLIEQHGQLPLTPLCKSGGGGLHYYFAYPDGMVVKSRSSVAPGIDVRADTGCVIAPPSLHESGNIYELLVPLGTTPLAQAPAWLVAIVSVGPIAMRPSSSGICLTMISSVNDFATHPGADEGTRTDMLMRLLGVHLSRGDSPATVEVLALAWGLRCTPPIPEADIQKRLALA